MQVSLPEINIPNLDDWEEMKLIEKDNTKESEGLTRAHSLQRNLNQITEEGNLRKEVINIATSNPSHLFWVPASQHPEIAPAEFEKYVDALGFMIRRKSVKRRQSVLSVSFTADEPKFDEEDSNKEKQDEDELKRRSLIRRSVSLHLPNENDDHSVPDFLKFDRNSSPLDQSRAIVPKTDRRPLHRRGARAKRNPSTTAGQQQQQQQQRPMLRTRNSESDFYAPNTSPEGITLVDDECLLIEDDQVVKEEKEIKEQVKELEIASDKKEDNKPQLTMTRSMSTSTTSSRKSAWSWTFWSDEKSSKKNKVDPVDHDQPPKPPTDNIPSRRFTLSSLFSRKSKHTPTDIEEKDTLQAPKDFQLNRMYMTRLPLHVERAIYKLSHVKLANPRRPLHEQVLISNLMFWYLSVISTNDSQQPPVKTHKLIKKKKRPPQQKKTKVDLKSTKGNTAFMPNPSSTRHQSTGFVVPENYLNPRQHTTKRKGTRQQLDSSSDEDNEDEDEDEDDIEEEDDDRIFNINNNNNNSRSSSSSSRLKKDDDLPLAMYKIKK
ncbi:hypothetical protein BCV71DRAFT_196425, partial [Rhizopus microsporus]